MFGKEGDGGVMVHSNDDDDDDDVDDDVMVFLSGTLT